MKRVVIIEDDAYLREELEITLGKGGYSVSSIQSFEDPVRDTLALDPNLVVLDLGLPHTSGFVLCKQLKAQGSFPILILTARDTLTDELHSLGLGADDFLTKPCDPKRLLARIQRLLQIYEKIPLLIQAGDISFDPDTNKVSHNEKYVILSQTEGIIFRMLIETYPDLVPKQMLFASLWGGPEFVDENILQVSITRLRKSLDAIGLRDSVETVRGRGYRLAVKEQ